MTKGIVCANEQNIPIFALRSRTTDPGFSKSTCSLRAVKVMTPVESPTRHSEIFNDEPSCRRLDTTVLASTTFTRRLWFAVPGRSDDTVTNTGSLFTDIVQYDRSVIEILGRGGGNAQGTLPGLPGERREEKGQGTDAW